MTGPRRGRRLASVAGAITVLLAVGLGACGGEGGDGSTSSSTAKPGTLVATSTSRGPSTTTAVSGSTIAGGGLLSASSTVNFRGVGPVRVGMTLAEASAAASKPIVAKPGATPECGFAEQEGAPEGVSFMVVSDRIARVDVTAGPVTTLSGAAVGDTEAQVQARYGDELQVSPHKYVAGGHYLTYVPTDPADTGFRLIFETDGAKVTRYRAGKEPEVSYVEGCS